MIKRKLKGDNYKLAKKVESFYIVYRIQSPIVINLEKNSTHTYTIC